MTTDGNDTTGMALGRAIDGWLSSTGLGELARLSRICSCWTEVVGSHVADHVYPVALEADVLLVDVDDPTWATELAFLSAPILEGLRQRLHESVPERLKARVRGRFGVE